MNILMSRTKKIFYNTAVFIFVVSLIFSAPLAQAQEASAEEMFEMLQQIHQRADQLLAAEFIDPNTLRPQRDYAKRLPRHVYHKARDVGKMLNDLTLLHQLPTPNLPDYKAQTLTLSDVKNLVVTIKERVDVLADYFKLEPQSVANTESVRSLRIVTSTDVYKSLAHLQAKLIAIGAPLPKPNDVFRIAENIFGDIQTIARMQGKPETASVPEVRQNITPKATYSLAYDLLLDMKTLLKGKADNFVTGGIVPPHMPAIKDPSSPDVLDLLINIQAEIHNLRSSYGAAFNNSHQQIEKFTGKTPQDVYRTLFMTQSLLWQFN